jgi:nucleotide-binding universal stress UspA family protein
MKLLCATDLLPKSDAAVDRAYQLRDALNARLTLLHVVAPGGAEKGTLEQRLLSASSRLALRARHAGPGVELAVLCGRPASVASGEARNATLAIIGPHHPGALLDALRGTFVERLLSDARCPVLVARRPGRESYRKMLLALDGSPASGAVLRVAERLPIGPNGEFAVVHAHEPPYEAMMNSVGAGSLGVARYASASLSQAAATVHAELQRHSRHPRRYRVLLMDARPGTAIRQAIRDTGAELLVLGTRGHGRFRRALLGSIAHEVLNTTDCDVLLVPEALSRATTRPEGDDPGPMAA